MRSYPLLVALAFAPMLAQAGDAAVSIESAMRCVEAGMTRALLPATASAEQLAGIAIVRCTDEIEVAAADLAGTPPAHDRVDASRIALRRELHDYAMAVVSLSPASTRDGIGDIARRADTP